jgi:hypothetical protein
MKRLLIAFLPLHCLTRVTMKKEDKPAETAAAPLNLQKKLLLSSWSGAQATSPSNHTKPSPKRMSTQWLPTSPTMWYTTGHQVTA